MPRFYVEPRPYCLIRAQKQNPFFLARAAAISLCKFRWLSGSSGHSNNASSVLPLPPPLVLPLPLPLLRCHRRCFFFSPRLPANPPLETTTRASCHHRRLVSHPATAVSSRLQPPPRETTTRAPCRRLVSRPSTTMRDHHARPLPLSRPSLYLSASVPASLHHHANTFVLLPQLSRRSFL